ncbi:MAG: hypothetical protein AAF804_21860, partial [Bacteroidota bacterium]
MQTEAPEADPPLAQTPTSTSPPQTNPPRRKRRNREGGLKLGDNLESMQNVLEAKKAELKEKNGAEETRVYVINSTIQIEKEKFQAALAEFAKSLEAENKMNLASILKDGRTTLHHNRWTFALQDDLHKNMIEREDSLVPFMREALNTPELFVEFVVEIDPERAEKALPYTDDEKLKEMGKINPSLEEFQK